MSAETKGITSMKANGPKSRDSPKIDVLSVFSTPFINAYACHQATVRAFRRHISLYNRSNLLPFPFNSPSPFDSKTCSIQYSANFRIVLLSPRFRNKSNVPIRIHVSAKRQTIAQGSIRSRRANRFGRTVNARARVVGIPRAFKCSEMRNSRIEERRTELPSLH